MLPLLSALFALLFAVAPAHAEPRFAARTGAACSLCHVNPTGGGMRNRYGRNVFETQQLTSDLAGNGARRFDAQVNDVLSLGGDFRMAFIGQYTRDDDAEVDETVSPPEAGLFLKTPTSATFFPMQADLYLAAELGERVVFYSDIGAQGSFEVMALFRDLPGGTYFKAGIFNAPYGTKLPNHTAAVRQPIGFDPRGKDAGVEIGITQPWLDAQVSLQNGDLAGSPIDLDGGKAASGRVAFIGNGGVLKAHVGGSALRIQSKTDVAELDGTTREATSVETRFGPFLYVSMGRLSWLGEAAMRRLVDGTEPDEDGDPTRSGQFVNYQELNVLVHDGVDLSATYEFMDRNIVEKYDPPDNVHRIGASVAWFPIPFVEANVIWRTYRAREDREEDGQQEVLAFLHLFF